FLDELPEFSKTTLEVLRQPLEDRQVTISRVNATLTFPADFILLAAMNPCPCGYLYNDGGGHVCTCTPTEVKRYTRKISGPLLDRIDIHIRVPQVDYKDLSSRQKAESSAAIRARVAAARERQFKRLQSCGIFTNAQMNHAMLKEKCPLGDAAQKLLEMAFQKMNLSARSYDRIIKVARTIADLEGSQELCDRHVAEAIQLRNDVGIEAE
ncbi:MAG: ATP-binding protein, partial [Schwartzia sp.]|nr:ATP-binding protein [Schwartzia sp. (in: firmicutes)]